MRKSISILLLLLFGFSSPLLAQIEELNRVVAIVDNDVITHSEFTDELQAITLQLQQQSVPLPNPPVLQRQVLERMILEKLQLTKAQSSGVRIDDEALSLFIENIAQGNGVTMAQFRQTLEDDNIGFAAFREKVRNKLTLTQLRNQQINNRVAVSDQEIDLHLSAERSRINDNSEYRLSHILIAVPEAASPTEVQQARQRTEGLLKRIAEGADFSALAVSKSDGRQALSRGDLGWRKADQLPTIFADQVMTLNKGESSSPIRSPSGFHILQLVDKRGGLKHITRENLARHILIRTTELISNEKAQQQLEQLSIRIEQGESFATLARTHSDDLGSAVRGGELGWAGPGKYVPKFQQEIDQLAIGAVSKPFKSRFGWHLIELLDRREQDNTEQFLRNRSRQVLRQRKIEEETELWLRRMRDEAYVVNLLNS